MATVRIEMTRVDAREMFEVYRLFHDLASLNPFGRPLLAPRGLRADDPCAFCGAPMGAYHADGCLRVRALRLYEGFAPFEDEPGNDPRCFVRPPDPGRASVNCAVKISSLPG